MRWWMDPGARKRRNYATFFRVMYLLKGKMTSDTRQTAVLWTEELLYYSASFATCLTR